MPAPRRSSVAQLRERLDQLAGDIFALEINTVIKPNMTVTPWPGIGGGILDIASEYSEQLSVLLKLLEARAPGVAGLAEESFNLKKVFVGVNVNFLLVNLAVEADRTGENNTFGERA